MAENDETSMIGYDPLAWMHETEVQNRHNLSSDQEPMDSRMAANENAEAIVAEPDMVAESENRSDERISTVSFKKQADDDSVLILPAYTQQIVLEPVQSIQNINKLHTQLLNALDNGEKIDIDASAVTMIDTATLQLLLVLKQTAIKLQNDVAIDFPSDKFIEAAHLLGLSEMLSVDQAASGFF